MSYLLTVKNLAFKFYQEAPYLFQNLSCEFESGKAYMLVGRNGSGKSTLFRLLQGVLQPQERAEGVIDLDGDFVDLHNLHTSTSALYRSIGSVPQAYDAMLIPSFTAENCLRLASLSRYPGLRSFFEVPQPDTLLERFKIPLGNPVMNLSGGQRQLISILAALQRSIKVLLLDEPTAALDHNNKQMVVSMLKELAQERNIIMIMICHDTEIIQTYPKEQVINLTRSSDKCFVNQS
jgi:ABC-type multidrug transport system ATPase subunit